jgi:hypothetical protein
MRAFLVFMLLWTALFLLLNRTGRAADWHLLELDQLTADYQHYPFFNANPYYPAPKNDELALSQRSVVGGVFLFDTTVHGWSDSAQYRLIGLELKLGLQITDHLDLYYRHHSQHLLDVPDTQHFPVEDSVGITLYFVRNGAVRKGLF